jgi:hypothetical protein
VIRWEQQSEAVMKPSPGASRRLTRRIAALAALAFAVALTLPLTAFAATAAGASGAHRADVASSSCPWLDQSLPVDQRVQMLMAQMSLADKINMVTTW